MIAFSSLATLPIPNHRQAKEIIIALQSVPEEIKAIQVIKWL